MSRETDFDAIRSWQGIVRDTVLVLVGGFMLIYETAFAGSPNPYVIGGGLTALGLPSAIRLDFKRRDDR